MPGRKRNDQDWKQYLSPDVPTVRMPPEAIESFKELYRQELGKEITDEQAIEEGTRLLSLAALLQQEEADAAIRIAQAQPDAKPAKPLRRPRPITDRSPLPREF